MPLDGVYLYTEHMSLQRSDAWLSYDHLKSKQKNLVFRWRQACWTETNDRINKNHMTKFFSPYDRINRKPDDQIYLFNHLVFYLFSSLNSVYWTSSFRCHLNTKQFQNWMDLDHLNSKHAWFSEQKMFGFHMSSEYQKIYQSNGFGQFKYQTWLVFRSPLYTSVARRCAWPNRAAFNSWLGPSLQHFQHVVDLILIFFCRRFSGIAPCVGTTGMVHDAYTLRGPAL